MAEVDRRLKIADFGENYKPVLFAENNFKQQLQLTTQLPKKLKVIINRCEISSFHIL